jgi:hypothetical protein
MGAEEIELFRDLFREVRLHRQRIAEAVACLQKDPDSVSCADQLIYRFSKMQDTMGRKLFRALLDAVGDWNSDMTMIDIVNRMDKLALVDPGPWKRAGKIRNEIARNYDEDPETTRRILAEIEAALPALDDFLGRIERFAAERALL